VVHRVPTFFLMRVSFTCKQVEFRVQLEVDAERDVLPDSQLPLSETAS